MKNLLLYKKIVIKSYRTLRKMQMTFLAFLASFDNNTAPIGLKSLGLQMEYLDKVYKNKFGRNRFEYSMTSPVQEPLYLSDYRDV